MEPNDQREKCEYVVFASRSSISNFVLGIRWGWKFAKDVLAQVSASTLTPKIPEYDEILELDKKLRQQGLPPDYNYETDTPFYQTRGMLMSATSWVFCVFCMFHTR